MSEKDPWALKLPWVFAIGVGLAAMMLFGLYGLLGMILAFFVMGIIFVFAMLHVAKKGAGNA